MYYIIDNKHCFFILDLSFWDSPLNDFLNWSWDSFRVD